MAVLIAITMPAQAARWNVVGPEACSDEAALRAAVAKRTDVSVDELSLDVQVTIVASENELTATVSVRGALTDSRALTSASCTELTDAIAVVIARLASLVEQPHARTEPAPPAATTERPPQGPRWNGGLRH